MSSQQLDEEAILEVARDIRNPGIRAKYLSQACADQELRARLEQKCKGHRRWQFGLRTLLAATVLAALLSAGLAVSYRQAELARRMAEQARMKAEQARYQAVAAAAAARAAELNAIEESNRE